MSPDVFRDTLASMTAEEQKAFKEKLVKSMYSPIKCGGCDYDADGSRFYWTGGKRIPEAEFHALQNRLNEGFHEGDE